MNDPRQFDELARRKLEEREFAFEEAAWTDMQRLLAKDRDRGGAWKWWTLAGAAVLLIGLALWWNGDDEAVTATSPTAQVVPAKPAGPIEAAPQLPVATEDVSAEPAPTETPVVEEIAEQAVRPGASVSAEKPVAPRPKEARPKQSAASPAAEQRIEEPITVPQTLPQTAPEPPVVTTVEPIAPDPTQDELENDAQAANSDQAADTTTGAPSILPTVATGVALTAATAEPADEGAATATNEPESEQTTPSKEEMPEPAPEVITQEVVAAPITSDSTTATTSDPAASAVPPPAAPPALVPAKAPWEISTLGGMMLGSSNYSGANSDAWKDDVSSLWAPGAGAELMHMGRNFGLGVGLHYTTYAEQLKIAERTATETITLDSNYFEPTPMMLLIVTDVIVINGVTYYVTETLDTVINVLVRSTMTTTQNRVVTPARDQTNRVSYFELPVLFDAHLVQGPWSLGIRGGPMVGFLTTRRGVVPNAAMDGYTDFSDQRFTEVVFGYTARAYVRYRFNDAWSVGLEPGVKGHLMNGLAEGDLSRRTTAWGGMLSVSYRLR